MHHTSTERHHCQQQPPGCGGPRACATKPLPPHTKREPSLKLSSCLPRAVLMLSSCFPHAFFTLLLQNCIGEVATASVACGVLGVGGNKGAVAAEFTLHRRKVAAICSHFAAHQASGWWVCL